MTGGHVPWHTERSFEALRDFSRPPYPTGHGKHTSKGFVPTVIGFQHKYPRAPGGRPHDRGCTLPATPQQNVRRPCVRPPLCVFAGVNVVAHEGAGTGVLEEEGAAEPTGVAPSPVPCRCCQLVWGVVLSSPSACANNVLVQTTLFGCCLRTVLAHGSCGPNPRGIETRASAVVWPCLLTPTSISCHRLIYNGPVPQY